MAPDRSQDRQALLLVGGCLGVRDGLDVENRQM
jgi:hypothetical protein